MKKVRKKKEENDRARVVKITVIRKNGSAGTVFVQLLTAFFLSILAIECKFVAMLVYSSVCFFPADKHQNGKKEDTTDCKTPRRLDSRKRRGPVVTARTGQTRPDQSGLLPKPKGTGWKSQILPTVNPAPR